MKVFLHYEDHDNVDYHKSLKITLPKSWKTGPLSRLLDQFVESYLSNEVFKTHNPLDGSQLHLAQRVAAENGNDNTRLQALCSDAIVVDELEDRADVYVCHGPSQTKAESAALKVQEVALKQQQLKTTVACTHFGCQQRFPKGGPYPAECRYHRLPPVFHETAKYWACCPGKKAYDWDDFQAIPGCCTGTCTEIKENQQGDKLFLGGTDLREQAAETAGLKSIDDFNKAQSAGGAAAAPVLERLQSVLSELGVEKELFQQVVQGMRNEHLCTTSNEAELLHAVAQDLGSKLKSLLKSVAAEQLRIN
jgi:CHORD